MFSGATARTWSMTMAGHRHAGASGYLVGATSSFRAWMQASKVTLTPAVMSNSFGPKSSSK